MRRFITTLILVLPITSPALAQRWVGGWVDVGFASLVRPITTTIRYANGEMQRNQGSGFVIGERFYTAYHNIQSTASKVVDYRIEIGGLAAAPAVIDIVHDLAVFDVPTELCLSWCNTLNFGSPAPGAAKVVAWVRLEGEQQIWRRGQVRNLAYKSALARGVVGDCEDNLVVEIDEPFVPGSSGGPVFDAASGAIVGLIQGSFETRSGQATGYYKPVRCLVERLEKVELAMR